VEEKLGCFLDKLQTTAFNDEAFIKGCVSMAYRHSGLNQISKLGGDKKIQAFQVEQKLCCFFK